MINDTANDKTDMQAYGFSLKMTEAEYVAELMKMYQKLVDEYTSPEDFYYRDDFMDYDEAEEYYYEHGGE